MIGKVLNGRYRLASLLGEGGMAVVYEAEDLLLGRKVAVKVLREQFASDPAFLARFQREARAAAGLSHPNVVAIHDVGSEGDAQYIVMELVSGRRLREIILEQSPLKAARILEVGRQVCKGLEYAHVHGVIHRDVKPENVLVDGDGRARIADFGIAVAAGASGLTQEGNVVGSARYLSPERARGEPGTARSDQYSVGVVLYEMATGRPPFEGETPVVVGLKHIQESPVPPRQHNPGIPESLQAVILRAMAKEPGERFGSCGEMAAALADCARAGAQATQSYSLSDLGSRAAERTGATDGTLRRGGRRRSSGHWAMLAVAFAAFLCGLASIPLGTLAYSSGVLGGLIPGLSPRLPPAPSSPTSPAAGATAAASSSGRPGPGGTTSTATPTSTTTPTPTPTARPTTTPTPTPVPFRTREMAIKAGEMQQIVVGPLDVAQPLEGLVSVRSGDIGFSIGGPEGIYLVNAQRVREYRFEFLAPRAGSYTLYLDNRYSWFTAKNVTVTYRP